METQKHLVTGAAGFIGMHLAIELAKRGGKVIGLDNFNDYYSPSLKRARADHLKQFGVEIVEGDICDGALLDSLFNQHKFTHVSHMAAQAGVRYSLENPLAYVKTNLEGFVQILEACKKHPGVKLVYASSSSVYGLNGSHPSVESDPSNDQASLYGATKKANELIANTYHHLYQIPVVGLRFFTVYGPWGRPDMAYYSFTEAIERGDSIKLFNRGKMRRDFTYIDDIISGILSAIDLPFKNEVFNLGNHTPVELLHFIEVIENSLGKKANKEFAPMQKGDVFETYANIEKSQEKLNFTPSTSIEEGIPKFIEWYKHHINPSQIIL